MRSMLLAIVVSSALALALSVAPAGAVREGGSNAFACKVLLKAIAGTALGHHATHLTGVGSDPTGCRYDSSGPGSSWVAQLGLNKNFTALPGGPRGVARSDCKAMLTAKSYFLRTWMTNAETGADVACVIGTHDKSLKLQTRNSVFAKGRWYGDLSFITPEFDLPAISILIKRVTAQLPR